jgi:hypothetical protein
LSRQRGPLHPEEKARKEREAKWKKQEDTRQERREFLKKYRETKKRGG